MADDMDVSAPDGERARNASSTQRARSDGERGRSDPDGERARAASNRMTLNAATRARTRQSSFSLPRIRASSFVLQRRPPNGATPADVPWGFDPATTAPDATVDMQNSVAGGRSRLLPVSRSLSLLDRVRAPSAMWTSPRKDIGKSKDGELRNETEVNKEVGTRKDVDSVEEASNERAKNLGARVWSRGSKASPDATVAPVARPKLSGQLFKALAGRKDNEDGKCKYKCGKRCKCNGYGKQNGEGAIDASVGREGASNKETKEGSWKISLVCSLSKETCRDRDREKDRPRRQSRGKEKPKISIFRRSHSANPGPNPNISSKDRERNSPELEKRLPISPLTDDTKSTSMVFASFNNWRSRNQENAKENAAVNAQKSKREDQKSSRRTLPIKRWKGRRRKGMEREGEELSDDEEILVIADVVQSLAHDDFIEFQAHHNKEKGKRRFRPGRYIHNGDSSDEE